VKQVTIKPKSRRRRSLLLPFLIVAILFHLLLFLIFTLPLGLIKHQEVKKPEEKPDYIEITEIPVPKEKETKPPEKTKRLAERSRDVPEETTIDKYTKQSIPVPPQPQAAPQPKPQEKKQEKQPEKKVVKKEKTPETKQPEKDKVKKDFSPADILRKDQLASLPKEKIRKRLRESQKVRESVARKETPNISKEELFSAAQQPSVLQKPRPAVNRYGARDVKKKEDTVNLSTTEFKYLSYFSKIKRQIEGTWNYPEASRMRSEQGQLLLVFTIKETGYLQNVSLLRSSGYARLDYEAIRAIKEAAPFPPFPKDWGELEILNINATFIYEFGKWFR